MQATNSNIDVKLMLVVPGNRTPIAKRIPAKMDFEGLISKAKALASKHNMLDEKDPVITYKDEEDWANLEVEDDDDLELAIAKALSSEAKQITFFIKTSKSVAQPVKAQEKDEDEEMKGDDDDSKDDVKVTGKKNKAKNPKMPRKALKALINQEFEKQSKAIFNDLLKSKDLDGAKEKEDKTDADIAQDMVEHTGVACDGCGVNPIRGIRYKCSVRKDFDYCQNCEERLDSPYAFLKIKQPGGAPSFLCTILDEAEEEEKKDEPKGTDFENLVNQFAQNFARGGGRGGRGGRGGMRGCRGGGGFNFAQMINEFTSKMGQNKEGCKPENFNKQDWEKWGQQWGQQFGDQMTKKFGGCHGGNQVWKEKRAMIISKPEDVFEAIPGQCIITEVEVLNDTFWPWKQGCQITLDDQQTEDILPVEVFNIPVEKEVKGKHQEKFEVPLSIPEHMVSSDKVYEIFLTFRGPKGNPFGQRIPVKIRIGLPKTQFTEADVYKLAIKFHENGFGSIEKCAAVVKENNCDEAACIKAFTQMQTDSETKEQ